MTFWYVGVVEFKRNFFNSYPYFHTFVNRNQLRNTHPPSNHRIQPTLITHICFRPSQSNEGELEVMVERWRI